MDAEQTQLGVTTPMARHVESVTTRTTTTSTHAPRRPSSRAIGDPAAAKAADGEERWPIEDYALLHLAPATTTTTVTTTTHTTTHFAPIRIPKSRPIRAVHSSFSGPSGDAAPRSDASATPQASLLQLLEESEAPAAASSSALPLDPRMYPLSQAPWPGSLKQFRLAVGGMAATFAESSADLPGPPPAPGVSAKGKAREDPLASTYAEDAAAKELSPFGTTGAARPERGPMHQRRLSRRARAHGGGQGLEWMEEEDEDARMDEARRGSPGPPRKRPRAESPTENRRASDEADAGTIPSVAASSLRASHAFQPALAPANVGMAATLPSPNQSPPSPVPTFGGEDSQELNDDEPLEGAVHADSHPQSFDFGSGAALSALLSLPDFIKTFDQLPAALQSYLIFQLLRRAPIPVLQTLNEVIEPSLRRDFLSDLPPELGATILGYLDARTLCRASLVCRAWKRLVDGEWRIWKDKLEADGLWVGDGSDEREAREIARGVKEDLFVKRWQAGVWDEKKRPSWTGKYEPENLYTGSPSGGPPPRASISHRLASPSSSREASPFPPAHAIHPFKLLYRRRVLTRRNWKHGTPKRITFPSSAPQPSRQNANNQNNANNHVVTCLQFDEEKIVSASDDHSISVFDTQRGTLRANLTGHIGGVWALQYLGNVLVSGSTDRSVRIWDLDTARCTHMFIGHTSTVRCLQIVEPQNINPDPNGDPIWEPAFPLIVTGSRDFSLRVWKLPMPGRDREYLPKLPDADDEVDPERDNPFHLRHLTGHTQAVRALAAQGNTLVSGSYDMDVRVWDITTGNCRHILRGHTQKVYSVVYDHLRQQCASGSMDNTVRLWSTDTGECRAVLEGHTSLVGLLGLTHRNLVSAAADWTLRIWDPSNGRCRHALAAHQGAITCFQHDEHKIISGSDGTLKMWDVQTGEFVRDLLTNLTGVWQVSFDQRFCVAAVSRNGRSEFEILDFGEPEPVLRSAKQPRAPRIKAEEVEDDVALSGGRDDAAMSDMDVSADATISTPAAGRADAASSTSVPVPAAPRLRAAGFPPSDSHTSLRALASSETPTHDAAASNAPTASAATPAPIRTVRRTNSSRDLRAQAHASTSTSALQAMDVEAGENDDAPDDEDMATIKAEEDN
ncbi:uncharacterized protein JCM10292_001211 [Rhodotorula paludigena]|uniref:uncharacterized protein n=1 Tax=Rhodotorula paludigena TaxID=86838 RepID=UPI00316D628A